MLALKHGPPSVRQIKQSPLETTQIETVGTKIADSIRVGGDDTLPVVSPDQCNAINTPIIQMKC